MQQISPGERGCGRIWSVKLEPLDIHVDSQELYQCALVMFLLEYEVVRKSPMAARVET